MPPISATPRSLSLDEDDKGNMTTASSPVVDIDNLWDFDDPEVSEARFRDALDREIDLSRQLELWTQVARTLSLRRRFADAHNILDKIESQWTQTSPHVRTRYYLERGRTHNSSGDKSAAKALFLNAWTEATTEALDALAVDAAHMLAIVAEGNDQITWNEKAMELAERSTEPRARRWRGSLYNNIGWSHFAKNEYGPALNCFERVLTLRREQGDAGLIRFARWCVARVHRALGRTPEALAMQNSLLEEIEKSGAAQDGFVYEELAECHLTLGQADKARLWFAKAFNALSQDAGFVANEPMRLERMRTLGKQQTI